MIIIQFAGGLGNQMFQYALYLQLKSLGKEVKIDDWTGFAQDAQREPSLMPFGINYERATVKELEQMLDSAPGLWSKVHRKLFGRNKKAYFEADKRYKPEIMSWDDIYLEGYWQTDKYFRSVSEEVKKAYDVDRLLEYVREAGGKSAQESRGKNKSHSLEEVAETKRTLFERYLAQITSMESVSVHIRRGDYLLPQNQALFGNICTEAYYCKAMRQMRQEYPQCRFYLFTNDKQWIKEQLAGVADAIEVVDIGEQSDYSEFILMSKCRHNILANSSFGWWASYLNRNPDKTVFAPDRWLNGWDCQDFYRDDMRRIAVE
ncbi:MAG: alpha-1,2-fucosyltransferase [Eubacterium sp.]|nr:alpha-1,2-fucosyltransferase [Eubacterium sp.]